jgi:hypothetical protein
MIGCRILIVSKGIFSQARTFAVMCRCSDAMAFPIDDPSIRKPALNRKFAAGLRTGGKGCPGARIWLTSVFLLFAVLCLLRPVAAQTAERTDLEFQIKAAYLFKFGSYIEWPEHAFASAESPLVIAVIGAESLADELTQMAGGRTVNGRQVIVRKLRHDERVTGANVLFIGRSNEGRLAELLATAKGWPMLVVTESDQALAAGSMINFVVVNNKVRFEVAPRTAMLGNLNISARLLAAAYKVAGTS